MGNKRTKSEKSPNTKLQFLNFDNSFRLEFNTKYGSFAKTWWRRNGHGPKFCPYRCPCGRYSRTSLHFFIGFIENVKTRKSRCANGGMGLMLGEFVDEYTVRVIDVFAMPQSGTGVSVEAVDSVFQAKMLDMLKQTGRPEMVVGWYHSHPGFGCWLSGVDINTQSSFEALSERAVAVVVDPIQSVKGKVVIDAFRTINPQMIMLGQEPRQTTSNLGHLQKPSIQALIHGLNRHYYSMPIVYRKNEHEQQMLMNLHKSKWQDSLTIEDFA